MSGLGTLDGMLHAGTSLVKIGAKPSALTGLIDMVRGTKGTPGLGGKIKDYLTGKGIRDQLKTVASRRQYLQSAEEAGDRLATQLRRRLLNKSRANVGKELLPYLVPGAMAGGAYGGYKGLEALFPKWLGED